LDVSIAPAEETMSETEIAALRALLTVRPRPTSVAKRHARLEALGQYL
jgi:hypothetical protein